MEQIFERMREAWDLVECEKALDRAKMVGEDGDKVKGLRDE